MGNHPADFHRARFSQLKPQLLVERSGGNVLRSRIKPYRFAGMLPRSFHRILDERGADAFPCGFRAYHDQMNDHHLLGRGAAWPIYRFIFIRLVPIGNDTPQYVPILFIDMQCPL